MTEEEMGGWHHQPDGHEFEQAPEDGEGQGSLACCSPWGCEELDMTEQLNKNKKNARGESGNPLQYCCLGNPTDRWVTVPGVLKSWTQLSNSAQECSSS